MNAAESFNPQLAGRITVDDHGHLNAAAGSESFNGQVGCDPGQVAAICLWRTRGTVIENWGGPGAYTSKDIFDLVLLDSGNRILAKLPAGGGWLESHRDTYVAGYDAPNWDAGHRRLLPVWSAAQVKALCDSAGVALTQGRTRRPLWVVGASDRLDDPELPTPRLGPVTGNAASGYTAHAEKFNNGLATYLLGAACFLIAAVALGLVVARLP